MSCKDAVHPQEGEICAVCARRALQADGHFLFLGHNRAR